MSSAPRHVDVRGVGAGRGGASHSSVNGERLVCVMFVASGARKSAVAERDRGRRPHDLARRHDRATGDR